MHNNLSVAKILFIYIIIFSFNCFTFQNLFILLNIRCTFLYVYVAKVQEKNSQEMVSVMHQLETSLQIDYPLNETSSVIYCADGKDHVHNILQRYMN